MLDLKLEDLMSQIDEKRAEAAISPEDSDPRIRAGVEAMVRQAKFEVSELEKKYKENVIKNIAIIAVGGDGSSEFAKIAESMFDTNTLNYRLISDSIKKNMRDRSPRLEFNSQEFFMLLDELNKIKFQYDMVSLPSPNINPAVDQVYGFPIDQAIDNILSINYGESLNSAVTRRELGQLALRARFTKLHFPIVLYNYSGSLDETYLTRPLVTVTVNGNEVNEKLVEEVLVGVRARLSNSMVTKGRRRSAKNRQSSISEETKQS